MSKKRGKVKKISAKPAGKTNEFADLCGVWTSEEAAAFLTSHSDLENEESQFGLRHSGD